MQCFPCLDATFSLGLWAAWLLFQWLEELDYCGEYYEVVAAEAPADDQDWEQEVQEESKV